MIGGRKHICQGLGRLWLRCRLCIGYRFLQLNLGSRFQLLQFVLCGQAKL